jgi:putative nucleotidyltransferase with HDIG domain
MRRLPLVLLATSAVLGAPLVAVTLLRTSGATDSFLLTAAAGAALSIAISYAGAALWAARAGGGDTVFGDLMIWGWLRRRRQERQLAGAMRLLGMDDAGDPPVELDRGHRVRLLEQLATGLEARHPDTSGHSRRVARHAAAIASRMGLPGAEVDRIRAAGALHDVGKVDIPAEIVNKPGALSEDEFAAIKRHAAAGARMVAPLGDEQLTQFVRHHHERLDGGGYPDGLAGTAIPLGARIVAVADTFDAVTSDRPYRPARRHREALALLEAEAGAQLDPDAVAAFCGYYSGLRPVAAWAALLNGARGLLPSLAGQAKLGGAVAAMSLAAVAAGSGLASQAGTGGERTSSGAPAAESAARLVSFEGGGGGGDSQRTPVGRYAAAVREDADRGGSGGGGDGAGATAEPSEGAVEQAAGERLARVPGLGSDGGAPGGGSRDGGGGSGDRQGDDPPLVRRATRTVSAATDTVTAAAHTVTDTVTGATDIVTGATNTVVDGVESTVDSTLGDSPLRGKQAPALDVPLDLGD